MKGNSKINDTDYAVLEKLYILIDLDKSDFAKICNVVDIETLIRREKYWGRLRTANDDCQARLGYEEACRSWKR